MCERQGGIEGFPFHRLFIRDPTVRYHWVGRSGQNDANTREFQEIDRQQPAPGG
jgi:hypothetical protein